MPHLERLQSKASDTVQGPQQKDPSEENMPEKDLPPKAEHVRISKRQQDGTPVTVYHGPAQAIQGLGMEGYLYKHIVPNYGPGSYQMQLIKEGGEAIKTSDFDVNVGGGQTSQGQPSIADSVALLREMQEGQARTNQEAEERNRKFYESMSAQKNSNGQEKDSMVATMMAMMMQQSQQKNQPDSVQQLLLQKILSHVEAPPTLPPMPPPAPPPPDPMPAMMEAVAKLIEASRPREAASSPVADALQMAQAMKPEHPADSLNAKDFLGMLPTLKDLISPSREGTDDFRKSLENLKLLRETQDDVSPKPDGSNFYDMVREILHMIPEGAITNMVSSIRSDEQAAATRQPEPRQLPATATKKRQPAKSLPREFGQYAKAMNEAQDDASLVGTVVLALQFLAQQPSWEPYVTRMLQLAEAGNIPDAMKI